VLVVGWESPYGRTAISQMSTISLLPLPKTESELLYSAKVKVIPQSTIQAYHLYSQSSWLPS